MVYFPSCKFTAKYPEVSRAVQSYLADRAAVAGCCRPGLAQLRREDTAVYICNTCAAFLRESSQARRVISLWEVILADAAFPYSDYGGRTMAVQDCWRAYDNAAAQDAVRALLRRMNVSPVELPEHHGQTRFCGCTHSVPPLPYYEEFAPKRLGAELRPLCAPCPPEEQVQRMRRHCQTIPTEEVVCACVSCVNGITLGGKQAVHLAQLLFPV